MTAKDRTVKAQRLREWWTSLRQGPVAQSRRQPTRNEVMLDRLRSEFALEPVTRFPRLR
jgi:hypothetical protein